jgi:hypothetical protein
MSGIHYLTWANLEVKMMNKRLPSKYLTVVFGLSGFLLAWIILKIRGSDTITPFYYYLQGLLASLTFFLWGCIGVLWIIRREAPQFIPLRGRPAVILGSILVALSWSVALYAIYLTLTGSLG